MKMRLRHIEVFQAVYSTGSVTQAAISLNVSQPSISKVLSHAELQLGFLLFERVKGKLIPTPEADRLYEHVAKVYEDLGVVKRVALNLRDSAEGSIRIASTPAMGMDLVPSIVADYMKQNPGVFFEIETLHLAEIAPALAQSRIDMALVFDPPRLTGIAEHEIARAELVLIAPDDMKFSHKSEVRLTDLAGLPFIRLNIRSPLGQLLETHLESAKAVLDVVAAAETYHIARSLVAQGVGVAIVDEFTASSSSDDHIKTIRLVPRLSFQISILQLDKAPLSRVCQKFADYTVENIEQRFPGNR